MNDDNEKNTCGTQWGPYSCTLKEGHDGKCHDETIEPDKWWVKKDRGQSE